MPEPVIPMLDLRAEVEELWDELMPAVQRVLRSGRFVGGEEVEALEAEVAAFLGVKHAIGLNSGTDALLLSLEALGIGPGDEVITTPFSFFATSEAILRLGATPVFADIDPHALNLDPAAVEAALSGRTRAIVPVHLFGLPADMERILELADGRGVPVVEDCAQAFGARCTPLGGRRVGTLGALGAFSFYPTKNLGAYGDAGLATTDDDGLAERLRSLRDHGSRPGDKYRHDRLGHNSRLDALQAAVLRVKLPRVEAWNTRRREVAAAYDDALDGIEELRAPVKSPDHVYHQYTVQLPAARRVRFEHALQECGVAFSRFYPASLTTQPEGRTFGRAPRADAACDRVVSLPIYPGLPAEAVERVAAAARGVLALDLTPTARG